jgi:cysteine dioxygenase
MNLKEFWIALEEFWSEEQIPLGEMERLLKGLETRVEDFRESVIFDDIMYKRNLHRKGKNYQALVLCWKAGQCSPIHDHLGSNCAFRVLSGTATEIKYCVNDGKFLYPFETIENKEGELVGSRPEDIHVMGNLQAEGRELITLHIYTPELKDMNVYSLKREPYVVRIEGVVNLGEGV